MKKRELFTVEEFLENELELLKFFRDNWKIESEKDDMSYPKHLFYDDWVEEFNGFVKSNGERVLRPWEVTFKAERIENK